MWNTPREWGGKGRVLTITVMNALQATLMAGMTALMYRSTLTSCPTQLSFTAISLLEVWLKGVKPSEANTRTYVAKKA